MINEAGITLIKSYESCELTAYQDLGGLFTIGWGHTKGVTEGMTCTQQQADDWFTEDVSYIGGLVKNIVPSWLNENQFAACVSLAYNIGTGNLQSSTLLKCLKSNDASGASAQFLVWDKVHGVPDQGILRRRQSEQALFNALL